jgi:hypothetical protein
LPWGEQAVIRAAIAWRKNDTFDEVVVLMEAIANLKEGKNE